MEKILISIVGILISSGITLLIYGQQNIRKEAREGRSVLHTKIDDITKKVDTFTTKVTKLEAQHKINHPGQ